MRRAFRAAVHGAMLAGAARSARRFSRAAADPERAQRERLGRFLRENRDTAYGRAHGYGAITSVKAFQERVPIVTGAELAPWVDRAAAGEAGVLTREPVLALERTSGTTSDELVPYTAGFLADLAAATGPWLFDLARRVPDLVGRRQYWAISPAGRGRERTRGGVPIGFEDDTEYFGPLSRWALRSLMAVPGRAAREPNIARWRRLTLERLLAADDLGLISVWSPSFLTVLLEAFAADPERYLAGLAPARAAAIRRKLDAEGRVTARALWPDLALVSCWTDGPASDLVSSLRGRLGGAPIQGKGLFATQGAVSFPLGSERGGGTVVAAASHVLEFFDLDRPGARPRQCHELSPGAHYSPILTTGAGLCRYHLKDVVRCTGYDRNLPLIRFEGKLDRVTDLAGEKLTAARAEAAFAAAAQRERVACEFALLAPADGEPQRYILFADSREHREALARLARALDDILCESEPYRVCRSLGQLAAVEVRYAPDGAELYTRALMERGIRLGDIKPPRLETGRGWEAVFRDGARGVGERRARSAEGSESSAR